jgi:hypothetical protein
MNDFYTRVELRRYDAGNPSEFGERIEVVVRIPEQVAKALASGKTPSILIGTVWQRAANVAIKTVGVPIPPIAIDVRSEVDAEMPPELPEASNFQDDDGAEGWIKEKKPFLGRS